MAYAQPLSHPDHARTVLLIVVVFFLLKEKYFKIGHRVPYFPVKIHMHVKDRGLLWPLPASQALLGSNPRCFPVRLSRALSYTVMCSCAVSCVTWPPCCPSCPTTLICWWLFLEGGRKVSRDHVTVSTPEAGLGPLPGLLSWPALV